MSATKNISTSGFPSLNEMKGNLITSTKGDKVIWAVAIILSLVSLLVIYSATGSLAYKYFKGRSEVYLFKQLIFVVLGLLAIYVAHLINYTFYARVAKILFYTSIPLLLYTLFFGVRINEGSRWIQLPVINVTFQTSDLAKLGLFMFLSLQLSKRQKDIKDLKKGFLPIILPVAVICLLIAPANLSTSLLIGSTSMLLLFIGRAKTKHLLATMGIALIPIAFLVTIAVTYYDHENHVAKKLPALLSISRIPTWVGRVQTFLYGGKNEQDDKVYQIIQAKIAIAQGGVIGKGPGKSEQRNFLPHPYSDFVFAIIIEEYGFAGAFFIVFIYLIFLYRCIRLFRKCPFAFGAFLALALSFTLVIQALTNMMINVDLFPNSGITLPLVSMGGSSFIFTCLAIGIILSVARNVEKLEGEKKLTA